MTGSNNQHKERVDRVLDYIGEHLGGDLSLTNLSSVACFSPYHFHRIFQAVVGETLNSHVRRVRLERAAVLLRSSPAKKITDVALEVGFAGTAEFSRAFRAQFGRTASSWDRKSALENSKISKAAETPSYYSVEELHGWMAEQGLKVKTLRLSAFRFAYARVFEPYGNTRLMDTYYALVSWLAKRGTDFRDVFFIGMSLDDPSITPLKNCRYDMGVAFPMERTNGSLFEDILRERRRTGGAATVPSKDECRVGQLSVRDFEAITVGKIHCKGDLGQVDRAWHYLYRVWLPEVEFEPADVPAMEIFVRLPEEIGWETFDLEACLPVVRR